MVLRDRPRNPSKAPNHNWLKFLLRKNKGLNTHDNQVVPSTSTNYFNNYIIKEFANQALYIVLVLEDKLNHQLNTQAELTVSNTSQDDNCKNQQREGAL